MSWEIFANIFLEEISSLLKSALIFCRSISRRLICPPNSIKTGLSVNTITFSSLPVSKISSNFLFIRFIFACIPLPKIKRWYKTTRNNMQTTTAKKNMIVLSLIFSLPQFVSNSPYRNHILRFTGIILYFIPQSADMDIDSIFITIIGIIPDKGVNLFFRIYFLWILQ